MVVLTPCLGRRWARPAVVATAAAGAGFGAAIHAVYDDAVWDLPIAWHNVASLWVPVELFGRDHVVRTGLATALAGRLAAAGERAVVVDEHLRAFCDAAGRTPRQDEQAAIAAEPSCRFVTRTQ